MATAPRFLDALRVLHRHEVDFIVVVGVAAVLAGAPVSTFGLDIMHRRTSDNNRRLLAALIELEARYRDLGGRTIEPDLGKLESFKLHRLSTSAGPVDVLTEIDPGLVFDDLCCQTDVFELDGFSIRSLRLEVIIRSKAASDRDKDRATLPVLRHTLELREKEP